MSKRYSQDFKRRVIEFYHSLLKNGYSKSRAIDLIVEKFGVSRTTVYRWVSPSYAERSSAAVRRYIRKKLREDEDFKLKMYFRFCVYKWRRGELRRIYGIPVEDLIDKPIEEVVEILKEAKAGRSFSKRPTLEEAFEKLKMYLECNRVFIGNLKDLAKITGRKFRFRDISESKQFRAWFFKGGKVFGRKYSLRKLIGVQLHRKTVICLNNESDIAYAITVIAKLIASNISSRNVGKGWKVAFTMYMSEIMSREELELLKRILYNKL